MTFTLKQHCDLFPIAKVEYQCEGFLEKNKDTVNEEHINVLKKSQVKCLLIVHYSFTSWFFSISLFTEVAGIQCQHPTF